MFKSVLRQGLFILAVSGTAILSGCSFGVEEVEFESVTLQNKAEKQKTLINDTQDEGEYSSLMAFGIKIDILNGAGSFQRILGNNFDAVGLPPEVRGRLVRSPMHEIRVVNQRDSAIKVTLKGEAFESGFFTVSAFPSQIAKGAGDIFYFSAGPTLEAMTQTSDPSRLATLQIEDLGTKQTFETEIFLFAPIRQDYQIDFPILSETGFAQAGIASEYEPQFKLYSDGLEKRRLISLPTGQKIDSTDQDRWEFPVGTLLWKEFRSPTTSNLVETRMMKKVANAGDANDWRFLVYKWRADQSDADLISINQETEVAGVFGSESVPEYRIPSKQQCLDCHGYVGSITAKDPVLGFSALQLSLKGREIPAPGQLHLGTLVKDDLLTNTLYFGEQISLLDETNHPDVLVLTPPVDPTGKTPLQIASETALRRQVIRDGTGYLHVTCGGCHQSGGVASGAQLFSSTLGQGVPARFRYSVNFQTVTMIDGVEAFKASPDAVIGLMENGTMPRGPKSKIHTDGINQLKAWRDIILAP